MPVKHCCDTSWRQQANLHNMLVWELHPILFTTGTSSSVQFYTIKHFLHCKVASSMGYCFEYLVYYSIHL